METPLSGGYESLFPEYKSLHRWRSNQLQAQGPGDKGMLYVEETQTTPSIQVSRTSQHTEVCRYCELSGMVAGFARTKEQGSPGEYGPQAWV